MPETRGEANMSGEICRLCCRNHVNESRRPSPPDRANRYQSKWRDVPLYNQYVRLFPFEVVVNGFSQIQTGAGHVSTHPSTTVRKSLSLVRDGHSRRDFIWDDRAANDRQQAGDAGLPGFARVFSLGERILLDVRAGPPPPHWIVPGDRC